MENRKIALVTGGNRGLGKDMALSLAKKGIGVVLTYNSNRESAAEVVREIESLGQKAFALQLNVGETDSFDTFISQLVKVLKSHFKVEKFDYLVNNAGIGIHALIAETSETQFDDLMNIHFKGVYFFDPKSAALSQ